MAARDVPEHLGILLTARCNLSCNHCLQPEHYVQDLDPDICTRIIREAAAAGVQRVSFSGGEPTLYPHLLLILKEVRVARLQYSITTNGLNLKRILRGSLVLLPAHVTVSLDGPDAGSHDEVRGKGMFSRTTRNVRLLRMAGLPVRIQFTLLRPLIHRIHELFDLVTTLKAEELVLVPPVPTASLMASGQYPTIDELIRVKEWVTGQASSNPRISLALGSDILVNSDSSLTQPTCGYLKTTQVFVDWHGRLGLCCQMSAVAQTHTDVIADLQKLSLAEALHRRAEWLSRFAEARKEFKSAYACLTCAQSLGKFPTGAPIKVFPGAIVRR